MNEAERLIGRHGYGAVSVRDILGAAEQANKAALSYHFGSKQRLVEAIFADRFARAEEMRSMRLQQIAGEGREPDLRECIELMFVTPLWIRQDERLSFARFLFAFFAGLDEWGTIFHPAQIGPSNSPSLRAYERVLTLLPNLEGRPFVRRSASMILSAAIEWENDRARGASNESLDIVIASAVTMAEAGLRALDSFYASFWDRK